MYIGVHHKFTMYAVNFKIFSISKHTLYMQYIRIHNVNNKDIQIKLAVDIFIA